VGDELVGQNGGVCLYFNKVDGQCRDFSLDDAADGVRKGEVGVCQLEIDLRLVLLQRALTLEARTFTVSLRSLPTAAIVTRTPKGFSSSSIISS
jgi:hypothetical protein